MQAVVLVLGYFVFLGYAQDVKVADMCFGNTGCSFKNLSCQPDRIFLLGASYGYKPFQTECTACSIEESCCFWNINDCFKSYTFLQFTALYNKCFGNSKCTMEGERGPEGCQITNSSRTYLNLSSYVRIQYICLKANATTTFDSSSSTTGRAVAIRYNKESKGNSGSTDIYSCLVDTVQSCSTETVVMLVKGPNSNDSENMPCSNIGFNLPSLLPCDNKEVSYSLTAKTTPFYIQLSLNQNSIDHASAVIRADADVQLKVKCLGSPAAALPSPPMPCVARSTPSPSGGDNSGTSAGAIAAGVLVPILVLVAAAIALFWYFRRFRQNPTLKKSAQSKGGNLGIVPPLSLREKSLELPAPAEARQSDYAEIHDSALQPPPGYFQVELDSGPAPPAAANDVDYDKIGHKKPAAHNQGNAYGRLGEVGGRAEVTDYSYDRLARGNQAAPDVIDSDYNTPGLTSEGDYNVAGIPKKQHVISGAGYDIAEVVTSENEGNDDVTPGFSVRIGQGGANDDATRPTMTKPGSASYELSKPLTGPDLLNN